MKKLKMAAVIGCSAMMFTGSALIVQANSLPYETMIQNSQCAETLTPASTERKLELITYYRIENGYLQYRRWNATLGEWYDPDWITIGQVNAQSCCFRLIQECQMYIAIIILLFFLYQTKLQMTAIRFWIISVWMRNICFSIRILTRFQSYKRNRPIPSSAQII